MDLRDQLQSALGTAYTIERELGGGGMSRVFVATETALGRRVVLKVLAGDAAAGLSADRFRREIQLAAALQHPHIVPLLSAGTAGELLYYTMPFVEGESLRARLHRTGELPVDEAVRYLREVASALEYAHAHGVVHRDIKPDNVLVSNGYAVVADFGVAKAVSASATVGSAGLTSLGVAIGTPAYMAPEQAAGDPGTDHRADIYAFGVMAYELLSGQTPFSGRPTPSLLAAHATEMPDAIDRRRPSTSGPLALVIMRCLEKRPADRWQTAGELRRALDAVPIRSGEVTLSGGATAPVSSGGYATGPVSDVLMPALGGISLLRAFGLYAAAFLGVGALAFAATKFIGLPAWVFPGALVIMALGLPVVVLTALAHRPGLGTTVTPGGTVATSSSPTGTKLAVAARPHLTWRRAVMGGAASVGTFALVVAGYMALRALGIGPAGSLLAAGTVRERDKVLVTDFAVSGPDSSLGGVVSEALRTDLSQSSAVSLISSSSVREALQRMQRPPNTRVDLTLGRDLAAREGIKALVDGDISSVGTAFVLTLRLVSASTGDVLTSFRTSANGAGDVIAAVDVLSKKLRAKIGESLKSVQNSPPLERVSTASLPALQKYVQGVHAADNLDYEHAAPLLEEAIALDSGFAMAYRKLAVVLGNDLRDPARVQWALGRAYALRDRLTDLERALTTAYYFDQGTEHDVTKAIAAYESALAIDSTNYIALQNVANLYEEQRNYERAAQLRERRLADHPTDRLTLETYAQDLIALARDSAARAAIARYRAAYPGAPDGERLIANFYANIGRLDSLEVVMRALLAHSGSNLRSRRFAINHLSRLAAERGKMREFRTLRAAMAATLQADKRYDALLADQAYIASMEAWVLGNHEQAAKRLDSALKASPIERLDTLQRPYLAFSNAYALAGRPDRAKALLAEFERVTPGKTPWSGQENNYFGARASIAIAERRYTDAVTEERKADVGACTLCALPGLAYAYDLAGEPDSALVTFERYVNGRLYFRQQQDQQYLAGTFKRLGELYEAKGEKGKAAGMYARFVDLWKDADPELQPLVTEVRKRLTTLSRAEK
jgi:eukaryotic-like serine/threonine-protein kinase